MGFDYEKPKLDADGVEIPYPARLRTRTCARCSQQWYIHEMVKMGEDKFYCHLCYDRPYGEDQHKRGDFP